MRGPGPPRAGHHVGARRSSAAAWPRAAGLRRPRSAEAAPRRGHAPPRPPGERLGGGGSAAGGLGAAAGEGRGGGGWGSAHARRHGNASRPLPEVRWGLRARAGAEAAA